MTSDHGIVGRMTADEQRINDLEQSLKKTNDDRVEWMKKALELEKELFQAQMKSYERLDRLEARIKKIEAGLK